MNDERTVAASGRPAPDYLVTLADWLAAVRFEDLPAEVVERACRVFADCLAAVAAGAQEPEMRAFTDRLVTDGETGPASVLGAGKRAAPRTAALINGTAGTFLELDEGNQFARGHPGIHVVPAALALGEAEGRSGREMLLAIVLGYEVGARIGIASKLRMSMHPHGTWGTVGAAVTAAKLMGYDAAATREIINLSTSLGLSTSRKTMLEGGTVRNSFAGFSNHIGLLAHDFVQAGFSGEADGIATVYGSVIAEDFRPEEMTRALGARYEIARNYFKRHACCRYNHAALDALDSVARARGRPLDPDEIDTVRVETYSLAAQLSDQSPHNTLAAKFSVPFAIATTIVNDSSGVESFRIDTVRNARIQALAKRVTVTEDPALTAKMPARRPARVRISLTDGSTLSAEAEINRGDSEDPYGPDELAAKFTEMLVPVWGVARTEALYAACLDLPAVADIRTLTAPLQD
ncbi:MAG: MmgE/PrpD family protein [Alphaproteobacteria bacterium]|nr:MmgE/PrpD family protein [Alphaproteobacteria bacterium]